MDSRIAPSPAATEAWVSVTPVKPDGLMVFDGVCNFCSGYVRLVLMMDREGVIRFTPIQSEYGRLLCKKHGVDPDDPSTFLFFDNGKPIGGTDGMVAMLARMPLPWRALRALMVIPRPIRNAVYRWTARNRYHLLGKRRECMIPPSHVRQRFVTEPPAP
jgi:predicted DCC family thiol-disulfide oxidoreductase YuxK